MTSICENCRKEGCCENAKRGLMMIECSDYSLATRADQVRSMNDEELANFISKCVIFGKEDI